MIVSRDKKGKAVDVVPVGMGEKQVGFANIMSEKFFAQATDSGAGIQDDVAVIRNHLQATGIAAVFYIFRRWTGNASPNPPKLDRERHPISLRGQKPFDRIPTVRW